ncbi:hypothetical protein KO465_05785 [Candidatus Micrarchaeota archaeon]|nr:hypothetical protein [Candidatus Micrarchaeota archaeon]
MKEKIVEMNPNILVTMRLYLEKFELLTEEEKKLFIDALKLYIYPKYVIDKLVKFKWEGQIGGDPNNPFPLGKKEL